MRQASRSVAHPRRGTPGVGALVLLGALLLLAACGTGKVRMTDAELDQVAAGKYSCGLFGCTGAFVGSFLQVFDPSLPPNPACGTGTNTDCVTMFSVSPLPPSGSVVLEQSFAVQGPFSSQSVRQQNSLTTPGPPPPLNCVACQLYLDMNFNRVPSRW